MVENELVEGNTYDVRIDARNPHGEGIGRIDKIVVFVRNAKTKIGKIYKVKITKVHRTFAYAEPIDGSKFFIGNGSIIV